MSNGERTILLNYKHIIAIVSNNYCIKICGMQLLIYDTPKYLIFA